MEDEIRGEAQNAPELIICDPYFSSRDLEFLKVIQDIRPELSIRILAGLAESKKQFKSVGFSEGYRAAWWQYVADQEPPDVTIVLCEAPSKGFPIHDRWILADTQGIRFGTSLNSVGVGRISEISIMREEEVLGAKDRLERFLNLQERHFQGEKLVYEIFNLV